MIPPSLEGIKIRIQLNNTTPAEKSLKVLLNASMRLIAETIFSISFLNGFYLIFMGFNGFWFFLTCLWEPPELGNRFRFQLPRWFSTGLRWVSWVILNVNVNVNVNGVESWEWVEGKSKGKSLGKSLGESLGKSLVKSLGKSLGESLGKSKGTSKGKS